MAPDDAPASPHLVAVPLRIDETASAARALARAFHDDPVQAVILPNADRRAAALPMMFSALCHATVVSGGHVTTTQDHAAVALWNPPGMRVSGRALIRAYGRNIFHVLRATPLSSYPGLMSLFRTLGRRRKIHAPEPHWYLAVLGVDPARQGEGLGSLLVREGVQRAEAAGVRTYLETESAANVAFYERLGFRVVEAIRIKRLGLPMWLMVRDPG